MMVDPPQGYRYGFPRNIDKEILESTDKFTALLLDAGYSEKDIDWVINNCRYWENE